VHAQPSWLNVTIEPSVCLHINKNFLGPISTDRSIDLDDYYRRIVSEDFTNRGPPPICIAKCCESLRVWQKVSRKLIGTPSGYEYREYKNWREIPKPRRCPFCKSVKGEIRKVMGRFQGVYPNCGSPGQKRQSYDEALRTKVFESLDF
jgi:hypothetical protein